MVSTAARLRLAMSTSAPAFFFWAWLGDRPLYRHSDSRYTIAIRRRMTRRMHLRLSPPYPENVF
jgi:hypothetical protein